jgi:hypothetical protein
MVELSILDRMRKFKRQVRLDSDWDWSSSSGTAAMLGPMATGATRGRRLVEHMSACPASHPRSGGRLDGVMASLKTRFNQRIIEIPNPGPQSSTSKSKRTEYSKCKMTNKTL